MKKIIMVLSIATVVNVVLHGCKKESANETKPNINPYDAFILLTNPISESFTSSKASQDSTFDRKLYNYSIGLDSLFKKTDFYTYFCGRLNNIDTPYIKYTDILSMYS